MPKKDKNKSYARSTARKRNRELYSSSIKTGTSGTKPVPGYNNSIFAKSVRVARKVQKKRKK